jgi:putative acetyltransferase
MAVRIRQERPEDAGAIARVIADAFNDESVAGFTAEIRSSPGYVSDLTFVAEDDDAVVGFTMLSEVGIEGLPEPVLILTPMAVRPDRQREGIGAALVRAAIEAADARREPLVLVEGVPSYYPRFGFLSATMLGLERPDDRIPEEAWLAVPLRAYDPAIRGRVVYPPFFPGPPGA